MKRPVYFIIVIVLLTATFLGYSQIAGNAYKSMTIRQKIIRKAYPIVRWMSGLAAKDKILQAPSGIVPSVSVYDISFELTDGETYDLSRCKGKKILFVNTASDCGFTPQYEGLQALNNQMGDRVIIIGFPSNDFKEQEKKGDTEIASFCKRNYGVTFPLAAKAGVRKGEGQQTVFRWLSDPGKNGWNSKAPSWNFSKYLVDETGRLTHYFEPTVDPQDEELLRALKE